MGAQRLLNQLAVGDAVEGFYILQSAAPKVGSNGKPFLNAVLADRDGAVDAKVWNYAGPVGPADEGKVVRISGTVTEFRGSLQIVIEKLRPAVAGDDYDLADLVPTAPIDAEAVFAELERTVESLEDADYAAVCREMLRRHGEELKTIPAAKSVHHAFLGGLLMHTANMLRTADFLAGRYGGTVDRSLLLAGTLLHDFSKAREFCFSHLGLVTEYSVKGQLLGHLVMGAQEVAEVAAALNIPEEKSVLLQHMLLSHHGEPEFGAAVKPMCAESELLSLIDMIDSRMEIYRQTLAEVPAGAFSGRVFALEKRVYHHG